MGSGFALALASRHSVLLYSRNPARVQALVERSSAAAARSVQELVGVSDLILLTVLPRAFEEVSQEIAPFIGSHHTIVSILSGLTLEELRAALPEAGHHFQMMPNLAVQVGQGVIAVEDHSSYSGAVRQQIEELFAPLGHLFWAAAEKMRAIGVLSGSSPALFALFIEALLDASVAMGLPTSEALPLLLQAVKGSIALLEREALVPSELRRRVAAPGGTTIAGVCAFEHCGGRGALIEAALAIYDRAGEVH